MSGARQDPRRLKRVSRPGRVALLVVLAAVSLIGTFLLGRFFQVPDWQAEARSPDPIPVWAPVEERAVSESKSFSATVNAGKSEALDIASTVTPAIVVTNPLQVGDALAPGKLVGVVSDQPYFVINGPVALYRDLKLGDSGYDVSSLQSALTTSGFPVETTGSVDWNTINAVQVMFEQSDFRLPLVDGKKWDKDTKWQDQYIPFRQLLALPAGEGTVEYIAPLASEISPENPLLRVRTSSPFYEFTADLITADSLKQDQPVTVRTGGKDLPAKVASVGKFEANPQEGQPAGSPVSVSLDDATLTIPPNQPATVVVAQESTEKTLAVPTTGIRTDANGSSYVIVQTAATAGSTETGERKVGVQVLRSSGGYSAVKGDMTVADRIRVS